MSEEIKMNVMGTGGVGKSALTMQFVQKRFVDSYDPTIEDSYRRDVEIDGELRKIEILDTAGAEQFVSMRDQSIKAGEGFLLVYSIIDESSIKEIEQLKNQIIMIKDNPDVPLLVVGNKCDMEDQRVISKKQGEDLAASFGENAKFMETSAKTNIGVTEAFSEMVRMISKSRPVQTEAGGDKDDGGCKCVIS